MKYPIVVAITGASGAIYARRLVEVLAELGQDIHITISASGQAVIKQELDVDLDLDNFQLEHLIGELPESTTGKPTGNVHYHHYQNMMSTIASGSSRTGGMVICPCSGATLSAVVHGSSTNLIHRAADVHLKERRKLILVPRETPLSIVHLENMKCAAESGAVVLPASPGWYHGVRDVNDLVDFVVARILDQLEIEHSLMNRWGE